MKDYFNILGLDPGASEDDIRRAYKRLAMQHHPDRGGDQGKFQEIQEAHSVLTDPSRRAQWEQQRAFGQGGHPGNFGFHFNFGPDFNDILRQFHGNHPFGGMFKQPQRNRDLRATVELDLQSTMTAQERHIEIRHMNGLVRTVKIDIPRGIQTGMQMRCAGHGDHSNNTLPAGDLYVDFVVLTPPNFSIDGINLRQKVTINCLDAILGTKITVDSVDAKQFEINIPPGTQHGTQFRMAQCGLWDVNHPTRGDMFVEVELSVPRTITADQLERLYKLAP